VIAPAIGRIASEHAVAEADAEAFGAGAVDMANLVGRGRIADDVAIDAVVEREMLLR
jgi:hypothetical protein